MHISPVYTPFNTKEVSKIVQIPLLECIKAKKNGTLGSSLYPVERASLRVAHHSLVDAAAFGWQVLIFPTGKDSKCQSVLAALDWVCCFEDQPIEEVEDELENLEEELSEFGAEYYFVSHICRTRYKHTYAKAFFDFWLSSIERGMAIINQDAVANAFPPSVRTPQSNGRLVA